MIRIKNIPIAWTNRGTYKNLKKVINNLLSNEELIQIVYSISHLQLVIKEFNKKVPQYSYEVYEEAIKFTLDGTYKNLAHVVNHKYVDEEFFQVTTTPTHLHLITRKLKN